MIFTDAENKVLEVSDADLDLIPYPPPTTSHPSTVPLTSHSPSLNLIITSLYPSATSAMHPPPMQSPPPMPTLLAMHSSPMQDSFACTPQSLSTHSPQHTTHNTTNIMIITTPSRPQSTHTEISLPTSPFLVQVPIQLDTTLRKPPRKFSRTKYTATTSTLQIEPINPGLLPLPPAPPTHKKPKHNSHIVSLEPPSPDTSTDLSSSTSDSVGPGHVAQGLPLL